MLLALFKSNNGKGKIFCCSSNIMRITHLVIHTGAENPIRKPELGHKMFHQKLKSWRAERDIAK